MLYVLWCEQHLCPWQVSPQGQINYDSNSKCGECVVHPGQVTSTRLTHTYICIDVCATFKLLLDEHSWFYAIQATSCTFTLVWHWTLLTRVIMLDLLYCSLPGDTLIIPVDSLLFFESSFYWNILHLHISWSNSCLWNTIFSDLSKQ